MIEEQDSFSIDFMRTRDGIMELSLDWEDGRLKHSKNTTEKWIAKS